MRHLITLVEDLRNKGIGFRSVSEGAIDTTCASGELIFNIFSALAQFERRLIQERTKAGLAAARGRMGGRPKTSPKDAKVRLAKTLLADKSLEVDDICETLKISRGPRCIGTRICKTGGQSQNPVVIYAAHKRCEYLGNSPLLRDSKNH